MTRRVLVADDEELIRTSLRNHLKHWGYEVKEASDGLQAIEEMAMDHFDLVICDGLMPHKTGWDLLKQVKSNPRTKNIPVILLTAKKVEPDIFKGYELGADYYMSKPFTKSQLLQVIQLIFDDGDESSSRADISN